MSELDVAALRRFVETFADRLHERREELTALDSAIGDADHGINMDRGFTAARAKVGDLPDDADLGTVAKTVGMTLISTVGGASGPLYGTFFLRVSTTLGEERTAGAAAVGAALRAGLEGLIHISELSHQRVAHPGDVVHEGQQLKLKIISLDSERHRLGLSLKQAEEPPARPAPEPGQGPSGRSERRGRPDRPRPGRPRSRRDRRCGPDGRRP